MAAQTDRGGLALVPPFVLQPPDASLLPTQQLAELMRGCRADRLLFDLAWDAAMEAMAWPASRREASEWRKMLEDTREGWRAAYEGWPQLPHEEAVGQLAQFLHRSVA